MYTEGNKTHTGWEKFSLVKELRAPLFPMLLFSLFFLPLSPFPSSKKSVMVAEVQRLQGLEASMEVRMDDMSRLSLFTPKRSSQNLESSWDKPSR